MTVPVGRNDTQQTREAVDLAATVKAGAHFYMAHRMTEVPHEADPEIIVATHVPGDQECPGCAAESALADLASRVAVLEAERDTLAEALPKRETCREWVGDNRCPNEAEFLLWGKLIPPDGLGPRCYDHAAEHVGHRALGDPAWAILDLRPVIRARAALAAGRAGTP